MSQSTQPRFLRFSRAPSLSTISSNEEADFHNPNTNQPGRSAAPHTVGGGRNPISIITPLSQQDHFSVPVVKAYGQGLPSHRISAEAQKETTYRQDIRRVDVPEANMNIAPVAPPFREPRKPLDQSAAGRGFPERQGRFDPIGPLSITPPEAGNAKSYPSDEAVTGERDTFIKTEWMWMLLQADRIPTSHNVLAAFSAWIVLAAYLVLPATFTTFKKSETLDQSSKGTQSQLDDIVHAVAVGVDHLGLAFFSAILAAAGAIISLSMWWMHRRNYLWLCVKIFMPFMLNSVAGLITTFVNVYTAQNGVWSVTAMINAIISGGTIALSGLLYSFYYFVLLRRVKREHAKHYPNDDHKADPMWRIKDKEKRMKRFWAE